MAAYAEGERTSQTLGSSVNIGQKYYGTSLAPASVNPNVDKNGNLKIIAVIGVVAIIGFIIYKKVK